MSNLGHTNARKIGYWWGEVAVGSNCSNSSYHPNIGKKKKKKIDKMLMSEFCLGTLRVMF